jgi:hypothetical protein
MNKPDIRTGMTVYSPNGYEFRVLKVDKGGKYPILCQSTKNGTVGRFKPSSLTREKD